MSGTGIAMSGTEIAYGAIRCAGEDGARLERCVWPTLCSYACFSTARPYAPTLVLLLPYVMLLRVCFCCPTLCSYACVATGLRYAPTLVLLLAYAMLLLCYLMILLSCARLLLRSDTRGPVCITLDPRP
eukprot:3383271-Rhodomonas_salina.1